MPRSVSLQSFLTRLIRFCIVPLLVLSLYLASNHVTQRRAELDSDARHRVENITIILDGRLESLVSALRMLAASPLVDDPERWDEYYAQAQTFREGFGGHVVFADLSMQMLFNTRSPFGSTLPKLPVPRGRAAAPLVVETGEPAVGDSFMGPIAGEQLVSVVVPVFRDETLRYLLLGTIETRRFQELIDRFSLPDGWALTIVDGAGEVMASRQGGGPASIHEPARSDRLFSVPLRFSAWTVTLRLPGVYYRSPVVAETAVLFTGLLAAALVSYILGKRFSRRLIRSIEGISEPAGLPDAAETIRDIETVRERLHDAYAEREKAETGVRRSLQEKETLIRELYHRTNNNMQLIQSLMVLQSRRHPDIPLSEFVRIIARKIDVMALVHRKLFSAGNLSRIDLGDYIEELSRLLLETYPELRDRVRLVTSVQHIDTVFDVAVPVGMILHELLSNALLHGFPAGRTGELSVVFSASDGGIVELEISDTGIGVGGSGTAHGEQFSGLELVRSIVEDQLGGSLSLDATEGISYRIRFTADQYSERV